MRPNNSKQRSFNARLQGDIFIAFFRSTMLGYGGGPSIIPLVHREVVERYKWLNNEEFSDVLAIGNTLPGPIATKMAGYIGYRLGGIAGLINAVIATVVPSAVLTVLLIGFLSYFRDAAIVQKMTKAVAPAVGVMLLLLAYEVVIQSQKGMGWKATAALIIISYISFEIMGMNPAWGIGTLILFALFDIKSLKNKWRSKKTKMTD